MNNLSCVTSLCANIGLSPEIFGLGLRSASRHWRYIHTTRCLLFATHYDTLKVDRNCSHKEIREAFLKLSKEFHPDTNLNNPDSHNRFIKLNDAYTILSKPYRRANYDLSLVPSDTRHMRKETGQQSEDGAFRDESFYDQRVRSEDMFYKSKPYYGIAGIKKLSNSWIVLFCVFFTVVGAGLQFLAISKSVTFDRDRMDELSAHNGLLHYQARQQAIHNGNEVQIQLLRKRLQDPNTNTDSINPIKMDV